ncbi:MAG: Gfo/Idh/MocA family oxidoreductase [Bryobacteraceae bacterium]
MLDRRNFLHMTALGSAAMQSTAAVAQVGRAAPKKSDKKIRLAVVGGGFGASFQFHEHPQCVVTAATDLYAARRNRLRTAYRCDSVYESMEDMLKKRNDIDAVAVFSGAPDHAKHVEACFERGLHVLSAVPACMTIEEAHRLKELKEKTGLKYMMAESSYYRSGCIYARNLFRQGGFGKVFYSEVEYYHDGNIEEWLTNKKSLYHNPDGSMSWRAGIPPMLYPTHSLGYVTGVTGERIESVSALGWGIASLMAKPGANRYNNPFSNEFASMRTDKGNMVRCNVFWTVAAGEERAQWFGEKGSFYMSKDGFHPNTWHERYGKPKPIELPAYWKSDMLPEPMRHDSGHGGSAAFISAEFINALLENREPEVDLYESLAMTVPGIIAHQSALKNGEQMKVPRFEKRA